MSQRYHVPERLLARLRQDCGVRQLDARTMAKVAECFGLDANPTSKLDGWWNDTISLLDQHYPDWRGYRVHYRHLPDGNYPDYQQQDNQKLAA